jgi:hypothetical protein
VKKDKFLQIADSWGGQTNIPAIYDEKFLNENNKPTCSLKIIWPKCTALRQPCDVHFFRHVKITLQSFRIAQIS